LEERSGTLKVQDSRLHKLAGQENNLKEKGTSDRLRDEHIYHEETKLRKVRLEVEEALKFLHFDRES